MTQAQWNGFDIAVRRAPNLAPPIKKIIFLVELLLLTLQLPAS